MNVKKLKDVESTLRRIDDVELLREVLDYLRRGEPNEKAINASVQADGTIEGAEARRLRLALKVKEALRGR